MWDVERVGPDLFRGHGADGAADRVFGGQVAAQALAAAVADAPDRTPASVHARFVREGRSTHPIDYAVERLHADFRRVTATQRDRAILTLDLALRAARPVPAFHAGAAPDGWMPATPE